MSIPAMGGAGASAAVVLNDDNRKKLDGYLDDVSMAVAKVVSTDRDLSVVEYLARSTKIKGVWVPSAISLTPKEYEKRFDDGIAMMTFERERIPGYEVTKAKTYDAGMALLKEGQKILASLEKA